MKPFLFSTEIRTFSLQIDLCNAKIYTGCTMVAAFNLPFTDWSIPDGTYVNFTLSGDGDSCASVPCQNDAESSVPNTCSFVYNPLLGRRLYVVGEAGLSAGFQATFSMEIIRCPKLEYTLPEVEKILLQSKEERPQILPPKKSLTVAPGCPTNAMLTKRSAGLDTQGQVRTSPKTTDAAKFFLSVCPGDRGIYSKVEFSLQATDGTSAFATYFCPSAPCSTNVSPVGWYDDSGTALNSVSISNLKDQFLWFDVYGWGAFQGVNSYRFAVSLLDQ